MLNAYVLIQTEVGKVAHAHSGLESVQVASATLSIGDECQTRNCPVRLPSRRTSAGLAGRLVASSSPASGYAFYERCAAQRATRQSASNRAESAGETVEQGRKDADPKDLIPIRDASERACTRKRATSVLAGCRW
jgi:hypothetical protein